MAEEATQEVGQEQVQQETGQGQPAQQTVPYERLQEIAKQNQALRAKNEELQSSVTELKEKFEAIVSPAKNYEKIQQEKEREKQFFNNPYRSLEEERQARQQELERMKYEMADEIDYKTTLAQFRSAPAWSQDIENKMASVIQGKGLVKLGRAQAIKDAYERVSGKEWGDWGDAGGSRQLKERLARPGSGGSTSGDMLTAEQFQKLSTEEYSKNPKKYNDAYAAWLAANK